VIVDPAGSHAEEEVFDGLMILASPVTIRGAGSNPAAGSGRLRGRWTRRSSDEDIGLRLTATLPCKVAGSAL